MKRLATATLVMSTMLMVPLAFVHADDTQDPARHEKHAQAHAHGGMSGNGAGMHDHMEQMKQTMERIHNTDDPAERERLLQEHKQQMHEAMGSMCKMMGDDDSPRKMNDMSPEMHRKMMRDHMQMMRRMMKQMKAHMDMESETAVE